MAVGKKLKVLIALAACVTALVAPADAGAVICAPPGTSGVSQYFETVPGASCNVPPSGSGGRGGSLPAGTSHQLSQLGATGNAVKRLVASTGTSPPARRGGHGRAGGLTGGRALFSAAAGVPNAVWGVLRPIVTGSALGGAGILLPMFLGGATVLLAAVALGRRRRKDGAAGE